MGCFYPLAATQFPNGEILIHKKLDVAIATRPKTPAHLGRDLNLPCGRCTGCKIQRAQDWATRCLHESQQHEANCFLTLTINEENLGRAAPGGSLSTYVHQLFMKKLRAKIERKVRFYMCGEYGEKLKRPHYHYLLFGYNFSDIYYSHKSDSGEKLYRSQTLEDLWSFGKCWIGEVTYESCAYVASYVLKKYNGEKAVDHYRRQDEAGNDYWLTPEFNLMSRGGRGGRGIASSWWEEFNQDVYTEDQVVLKGGKIMRPPRYYDKLLEFFDPVQAAVIKMKREERAKLLVEDNTPARLAVKETVLKAKLSIKKRNLESLK